MAVGGNVVYSITMSFWILIQVLLNIFLLAGLVAVWYRLSRPTKDDPRLSKGLQLLQSKIAILEDLSDRTETQSNQLMSLIEQKCRQVQEQILQADKQIQKIEMSMTKSLEVARIFQDRIPHEEIIERQNTMKYVKAARMAHQGVSVQEISQAVDLPLGEIELIAKVNKDQLQFSEEALPEWAKEADIPNPNEVLDIEFNKEAAKTTINEGQAKTNPMEQLGEQFRKAIVSNP